MSRLSRSWAVRLGAAIGVPTLLCMVIIPDVQPALAASGDWPTYQIVNARSGLNAAETQITPSTASNLKLHWTTSASGSIFSQPVVAGGTIYWGSFDGFEHATDLSGKRVWNKNLGLTSDSNCTPPTVGVASTATAAGSTVYVGGGSADFYALNASNGHVMWRTGLGSSPSHFIWSSPAVYNGSVYVGVASFGDCPLVQGQLVQMNASTGAIQHIFNTVPNGCTGAGVWGSPTIDEAAGTIFFATGNPGQCGSPEIYSEAVVEVNASDLSYVSSWQVRAADAADLDFGSTPTLFQVTINGVLAPRVGVVNKDGFFYALNRGNLAAGPVWKSNLAQGGACPQCGNGSIAPPAWDGSTLYAGGGSTSINGTSCAGSVNALDPATGSFIWRSCMPDGPVLGALAAAPGVLFVGEGPYFKVLAASTGNMLFQYHDTNSGSWFWGAASVSNGVTYTGNKDGSLYSFGF